MERVDAAWRKSTYSGNGGADCVEVGQEMGGVLVRDTKNRDTEALAVPGTAWRSFLATIR